MAIIIMITKSMIIVRASIMTLSSSSHPSSLLIHQPCVTSEPPVATIITITNLLFDPEALQLKRGCIFTRSKTFTLLQHEILLKLYILFNFGYIEKCWKRLIYVY